MFFCGPGSEVCVPLFALEKAHTGAQSHLSHNGPWATEHHSGFAEERLMFVIIALMALPLLLLLSIDH